MKTLDQFQLAKLVGSAAALMLFGQNGACIGRTFNLTRPNGRNVTVTMTAGGAVVTGSTEPQQEDEEDGSDDDEHE